MNTETALKEAGRKAGGDRPPITAQEQDRIVEMLRTMPIADVRRQSRRPYSTLCKIARVAL
ncbi:hypothetical protein SAMN02927924_01414 [Sphingobium faniae]|nr:hypothetical protein SAMN02927924_01414 [Sphingobium faniae]